MTSSSFFLGRQPVIDSRGGLVAYELLFQSTDPSVQIYDSAEVCGAAISYAFTDLGIEEALGGKQGLVKVSAALLSSDVVRRLPAERIVVQIPNSVAFTPEITARCGALCEDGFRLALADVAAPDDPALAALNLMSMVKIDVPAVAGGGVGAVAAAARAQGAQLIAQNIDTAAQNQLCRDAQFEFYQGYYFARPVILPGHVAQASTVVMLKLVSLIEKDAEIEELVDALKRAPDLTLRLLKTVNSAGMARGRRIESVRDAIMVLGRAQLNRLVQIMMFRHHNRTDTGADPITQLAVIRGRLMETVAHALGWAELTNQAFMTGMLSLVDTLFGQELAEIVTQLDLDEAMAAALLRREGRLGALLQLAEASELEQSARARALLAEMGLHDVDVFNRLQLGALTWANKF